MIRRLSVRIFCLPLFATAALGASPVSAQMLFPTADQVLSRHEAAVGGRAALDAHTSIRTTGVIIIAGSNIRGTVETFRAKPDKYMEKMTLSDVGEMQKGYDGTTAWVVEMSEPGLLTDADAESMKRLADWHHEFLVSQAIHGARVDTAEFDGQPAWQLTYASGIGEEIRSYFNRETGLRIGEESVLGVGESMTTFGDYKDFGGVRLPTRILTKRASGEMLLNVVTVEFDKVPASAFSLPAAVKAIAKGTGHTPS
jgi:hypothetical protein